MSRQKQKKWIYIAGPISKGDSFANVHAACRAWVDLECCGFHPICPHWSALQALVFPGMTHEQWLEYDFETLRQCDALLRLPGESVGADKEVEFAKERGIPVYTSIDELLMLVNPK